jgi:hypothetical protein
MSRGPMTKIFPPPFWLAISDIFENHYVFGQNFLFGLSSTMLVGSFEPKK